MAENFGDFDPQATRAINRISRETHHVSWTRHSRQEMENDEFDDKDVLTCLRKGHAHGPELVRGESRYNVLHRGHHIRVVVGVPIGAELAALGRLTVVTVMRIKA